MKQAEQNFEELIIPRKELGESFSTHYRVYSSPRSYKIVSASSALEALTVSGVGRAYKIERHNPLGDNVIQIGQVAALFASNDRGKTDSAVIGKNIVPNSLDKVDISDSDTIEISIPEAPVPFNNMV